MDRAENWHHKQGHNHPYETCWTCGRERARCRAKVRYKTYQAADEALTTINEARRYFTPLVRYNCRYCPGWHLATARAHRDVKRAERARRKWLHRQHVERLAWPETMIAGPGG